MRPHERRGVMPHRGLALLLLAAGCAGDPVPETGGPDCVVLLHGMARSAASMNKMAHALHDAGYTVANVDYPSREHAIEDLAAPAIEDGLRQCRDRGATRRIHFVTHSLGGILLRYYTEDNVIRNMGRTVMLGPPNQGSAAADAMRDVPGFEWLNGPAGLQLGKGAASVPRRLGEPSFEFAVIAGDRSIDPVTSAVLDNPDDGRVSVADTRLAGMSDFRVLHVSHAFMMRDDDVIRQVEAFLAYGRFDGAGDTAQ